MADSDHDVDAVVERDDYNKADDHKRRAIALSINAGKALESVNYHVEQMTQFRLKLGDRCWHLQEAKCAAGRLHKTLGYSQSSMRD